MIRAAEATQVAKAFTRSQHHRRKNLSSASRGEQAGFSQETTSRLEQTADFAVELQRTTDTVQAVGDMSKQALLTANILKNGAILDMPPGSLPAMAVALSRLGAGEQKRLSLAALADTAHQIGTRAAETAQTLLDERSADISATKSLAHALQTLSDADFDKDTTAVRKALKQYRNDANENARRKKEQK